MRSQSPGPFRMVGGISPYFSAPLYNNYTPPGLLLSPPLTPQGLNYVSPVEYYPSSPPLNYNPSYIEHSPYLSYPSPPPEYVQPFRPTSPIEHFDYNGNYWKGNAMRWTNTLEQQYVDECREGYPYSPYVDSQIDKYNQT
jgi:hypothetical protein